MFDPETSSTVGSTLGSDTYVDAPDDISTMEKTIMHQMADSVSHLTGRPSPLTSPASLQSGKWSILPKSLVKNGLVPKPDITSAYLPKTEVITSSRMII